MSLINNIGSLVGMFTQPDQNEESKQLAKRAGVDTKDFGKIAAIALPLLLQAMNINNQNSKGLTSFNQALNQHQTKNNYDSLNQFAQNVDTEDGDKIVSHVLQDDKQKISDNLAGRLGVSSDTVKKVLAVLAPLVIKYLADQKYEKKLDAEDIQRETQTVTREATTQVKKLSRENPKDYGVIGDLLGLGSKANETAENEKDRGLLGGFLDLFK